ncbi:MAG TPA: tetratricopeptide repeat protein [Candidatus Cybelea sp.]|nr:tetratricopeptide repeat protein [Candidatus Cybelea sp.]
MRGLVLRAFAVVWLGVLVAAGPASAETASEAAFAELLKDPGNLDKNLVYAKALVAEGDVEGAIAVLERLVLLYPDHAQLHVTLGELYQRAGSDAAAAQAYAAALAAPNTTPAIKAQAEALRKQALNKTAPSHFSGSVFLGMQYQTNANAGPYADVIFSQRNHAGRPHAERPSEDVSGVMGFNVNHTLDFGRQDGMALESRLTGFGQLYDENSKLDTGRINGQVALGFYPFPADGGFFRLTPRVNFEAASADGEWLDGGGGPGIGARLKFNEALTLDLGYDAVYRNYDRVSSLGHTEDYTGFQQDGTMTLTWLARPGTTLIGSVGGRSAGTEHDSLDYAAFSAALAGYQTYSSPVAFLPRNWLVGLSAAYEHRWYEAADPHIDGNTRRDSIWQFDLVNSIPLSESWSLNQQVEYLMDDSNLRNYTYDNVTVAMSARWRF